MIQNKEEYITGSYFAPQLHFFASSGTSGIVYTPEIDGNMRYGLYRESRALNEKEFCNEGINHSGADFILSGIGNLATRDGASEPCHDPTWLVL